MKILLIAVIFFSIGCKQTSNNIASDQTSAKQIQKPNVTVAQKASVPSNTRVIDNSPTPDFPFNITLKDLDGKLTNSNKIFKKNGKPTVLLFWLSTCGPCKIKMSKIKPIYAQWQEEADFNLYAISGDWSKNFDKAVDYATAQDWPFPTYNDVNRGFREILPGGLNGYPQSFIFDKEGKLVFQDRKFRTGDEMKLWNEIKKVCAS